MERPTEDTYVTELVSVIKEIGGPIGFDAEFNWKTPSGKPDVKLYYGKKPIAIIEVKRPDVHLTDRKLENQAKNYAEWYRKNLGMQFYGIHNMKYLKLFQWKVKPKERTLLDFIEERRDNWVPVSDFPFKIMPWVRSINEYKQISANRQARKNLEEFLLRFREILEGKTFDLSKDVIETIKRYIEEGASKGLSQIEFMYKSRKNNVYGLFEEWRKERGIKKPKNDNELRELLTLMLKEQLYTFSMKVLFYLVLQSIDAEMATKLKENLAAIEPSDPEFFKKIFEMLFQYAIQRTGDFEEVFGTNTIDRLPIIEATLQPLKELISYLSQIRWSDINVDIIGRIFEGLIYTERRHLLGQHYTDTKIVDLILTATLQEPDKLLDPACGSGTFLVRALNYWKVNFGGNSEIYSLVNGIDIDKLASMLSKINLYIQALEKIKEEFQYYPNIYNQDFFKSELPAEFSYVVTNPPYTRQEEMKMAFYDEHYKRELAKAVADIEGWSKRASIYAYFLVKGGKLLRNNGRLGFIIENSWLNAEYGKALKAWLLDNFKIEYVIESLVERWFEDAAIITNILIAQKTKEDNYIANFMYLKKPIEEIFGNPPPANDFVANQRYYETIREMLGKYANTKFNGDYAISEDGEVRVVSVKKSMLKKIEKMLGKLGILKAPKRYLEFIIRFIEGEDLGITLLDNALQIKYGLKTNANEIFYLPSSFWEFRDEDEKYLVLGGANRSLKISKKYLMPLIRPAHLEGSTYNLSRIVKQKHEDYVLWVQDISTVEDGGTREYLNWARKLILEESVASGKFPTIRKKIESDNWTKLTDTSGGLFLFRNAAYKNYSIFLNSIPNAQIDLRLYAGYPRGKYAELDPRFIFASLNSVLTYLGMELIGRTNLGEGALDIKITDYQKIPIVDPIKLADKLERNGNITKFLNIVDQFLAFVPEDIEIEARNRVRLSMEKFVLGSIGFTDRDIVDLYDNLICLVNFRTERAKSTSKNKSG
ncbi:MAG: HsdM family class I SAM-dependent methyltransferase [Candidatus Heimdallarchaeaceae archaeon]